jgi:hypothetical protein
MVVDILHAELEGRGNIRLQRGLEPVRKRSADLLRADQVELAGAALGRGEFLGERAGDFILAQTGISDTDAS